MTEIIPPDPTGQSANKRSPIGWLLRGRVLAMVGIILLLLIVGIGLSNRQRGQLRAGEPAPPFTITAFERYGSPTFSLEALRGKVVLVNFWASWCVPCEEEADILEQAWQHYKDNPNVVFIGVAWSDMDTKANAYLAKYGITYPNGPDQGTTISQDYRITGVPETYVIDQDGKLAYVKFSQFISVAEVQSVIDSLLSYP